eukprot:IDg668t1
MIARWRRRGTRRQRLGRMRGVATEVTGFNRKWQAVLDCARDSGVPLHDPRGSEPDIFQAQHQSLSCGSFTVPRAANNSNRDLLLIFVWRHLNSDLFRKNAGYLST